MAKVRIDGRAYDVDEKKNLLQISLELGFDLPYFCWHPALGSVGACRQCAVKQFQDESDQKGRLVMACMTLAKDETRISIGDPEARAFRKIVIEWLMVNHPHDCPVCDEGGECHLQDMTIMAGHVYRRARFPKRTFRNQHLGPFIHHEMNRCIECYRCVRFYRDYAGGRDLNVFAAHDHVYFGRHEDGVLENEFSGNLVEVCPTGVFTDKTLRRHYTRKWDLSTAPSICPHCAVGCNTFGAERYGELRRILNRYHREVNGYFLCDRGRFGYEFVNGDARVREPLVRHSGADGELEPATREEALDAMASALSDRGRVLGIGSPRASLEANFALRTLVGEERFYQGVSSREEDLVSHVASILRDGPVRTPSLREVEEADAVLVLGEDVTSTAPRLALAIRRALWRRPLSEIVEPRDDIPLWHDAAVRDIVQDERSPLFIAAAHGTRLDEVATGIHRAAPDDCARLGFQVAHALDDHAPAVDGADEELRSLAKAIAHSLATAERPLVISGVTLGSRALVDAASNVARALEAIGKEARLSYVLSECNQLGLALLDGRPLEEALRRVEAGDADTLVVLENDLFRRLPYGEVEALLERAPNLVVLDHILTPTAGRADVVLPVGTFAESDGTLVNSEGRAQRFHRVLAPEGTIQDGWRWLEAVAGRVDGFVSGGWERRRDVTAALAAAVTVFSKLTGLEEKEAPRKIPRQPHRQSGRTAMSAHQSVHEPKPPEDPDSPLAFSMEGSSSRPPPSLVTRFWAPGWNSEQSLNKFQEEIGGSLEGGSPGIRLLEPSGTEAFYLDTIPEPFEPEEGRWLLVPLPHLFGSEELSRLAPAVAELAPEPYVALRPEAAAAIGVEAGDRVTVRLSGASPALPVRIDDRLPRGIAGLPAGGRPWTDAFPSRWAAIESEASE